MLSDHGRHLKVSSLPRNQLFRFLDRKVPKEYFSHFYFTGFVFSGWLWATLMSYSYSDWRNWAMYQFLFHLARRYYEQKCIMNNYSERSLMTLSAYLLGLSFYPNVAISLILSDQSPIPLSIQSFSGSLLALSMVIQFWSHIALGKAQELRNQKGIFVFIPGSDETPFYYCLCPHYLSEICIYLALFLQRMSVTTFCMFGCVLIIMITNSFKSKLWYESHFPAKKLPATLIPGIW